MKILELVRLEETDAGTIGILKIDKLVFCFTLEPKDMENKVNVSSIPAQQYICKRVESPTHGDTFEVMNVPGRSHVLFHKGNTAQDTQGCILLGEKIGFLHGKRAVLQSEMAFYEFMETLNEHRELHLTIQEIY
jgi:hypothetical protein